MIIPNVNLIAAVGRQGQLGLGGILPWHDRTDLCFFMEMTAGDRVLFGAGTLAANPHLRQLRHERIIIEDLPDFPPPDFYAEYVMPDDANSFEDGPVLWIAGGAKTYARWLPYVRNTVLTHIDYDGPADVWMPPLWDLTRGLIGPAGHRGEQGPHGHP